MNQWQNRQQKKQDLLEKKASAGFVSDRLKGVSAITIGLAYYQRSIYAPDARLLMCRTIYVLPEDYAYFDMQCMTKECNGSFNLGPVIKRLVESSKHHGKGSIVCSGKDPSLPAEHATVNYDIDITYGNMAVA